MSALTATLAPAARPGRWLARCLVAAGLLAALATLALVVLLLATHQALGAAAVLAVLVVAVTVCLSPRLYAWRYVLPGAFAVLVFIVVPMAYTVAIAFTNYSSAHLLGFERSTHMLLERHDVSDAGLEVAILREAGGALRVAAADDDGRPLQSTPFAAAAAGAVELQLAPAAAPLAGVPLSAREKVAAGDLLERLVLVAPDGRRYRQASLGRWTEQTARYRVLPDGTLEDTRDGSRLHADHATGYWRTAHGDALEPGFRTPVGLQNYERIFGDARFLAPFGRVFAWTVSFATLNTVLTFALGLVLAVALSWPALRGRAAYRLLLFLPYAVPAFISIPVFRGLFNENLGEINLVLDLLFGVRPGWFSDATLARAMVLMVNTWLGYPYMMILAMGILKAIPEELYEASALAGAGPLTNLFRITLPLVARPIAPLLVASFAVNFNNLTLIALLTEGAPDFLDTDVPAGATDLLASYTYRIAFFDGGQNYALACAISTLVFVIVAALAVLNLRLFKAAQKG